MSDKPPIQKDLFSTRALLGLAILALIGIWHSGSVASNTLTSKRLELTAIEQNIARLESLQQEATLLDKREEAESARTVWEARLLSEGSRGLNMITLTEMLTRTLSDCGVDSDSPEVEFRPDEQNEGFDLYTASVQGRDPFSRFPICLDALEQSPIGLSIDELVWTHTGTLIIVANAFGRRPT